MRLFSLLGSALVLLTGGSLLACAASTGESDAGGSYGNGSSGDGDGDGDFLDGSGTGGSSSGMGGFFGFDGEEVLPEEVEEEQTYHAPVVSGRFLWSANPESGRVALIDGVDLSVRVLPAGLFPTFLTSLEGKNGAPAALVLNVGSSDATRFIVDGDKVLRDVANTHVGANRWSTSKNWAVAWSAKEVGQKLDPTEGLQEVTVLQLLDGKMKDTRLTVGYRPSQVQISSDEKKLIVVAEEGITLVSLGDQPKPFDWIDLGFDAEKRDVSLSADGRYAIVRRTDEAKVEVIDLDDPSQIVELTFSGAVTDLDLSPSGRAVAVVRGKSQVFTFLLSEVLSDSSKVDQVVLDQQLFGSVEITDDGSAAVVFTNVVANDVVNVINLSASDYLSYRQVRTQSPVYSVNTSPDGAHALVLAGDGSGSRASAFSVLSLKEARFPRVVGTGMPVKQLALHNDIAVVAASDTTTGSYEAHLVELPGLRATSTRLASEALSVGILPSQSLAYAAQVHPEGRVTFFDFAADKARTLTGFELSAEVVDE